MIDDVTPQGKRGSWYPCDVHQALHSCQYYGCLVQRYDFDSKSWTLVNGLPMRYWPGGFYRIFLEEPK